MFATSNYWSYVPENFESNNRNQSKIKLFFYIREKIFNNMNNSCTKVSYVISCDYVKSNMFYLKLKLKLKLFSRLCTHSFVSHLVL